MTMSGFSRRQLLGVVGASATVALMPQGALAQAQGSPLPSWNDGPNKKAIIDFVQRVTREGGADYVAPELRIATFDNDGTLWVEQPMYVQGMFVIDRVRAMGKTDASLLARQPFQAIAESGLKALADMSEHDIAELVAATHSGMTTEDFEQIAKEWLAAAKHPRFNRLYTQLVYQPQIELLDYLRANGFQTFIVSGGGVDFMRAFAEKSYGVSPQQVIGSSGKTRFELRNGHAYLVKLPELNSIDDKAGKPININLQIGRRPLLAFGNSDGDLQMLQYAAGSPGPRLMLLVHHDDAEREYAYDRESKVGKLDKALDEAKARNWNVVSMKNDWGTIFPSQEGRAVKP
jgi:hypothetical protein